MIRVGMGEQGFDTPMRRIHIMEDTIITDLRITDIVHMVIDIITTVLDMGTDIMVKERELTFHFKV